MTKFLTDRTTPKPKCLQSPAREHWFIQVNDAKKQVQDIAVKAIEGASGSKTLQFAMEQAKARTVSA